MTDEELNAEMLSAAYEEFDAFEDEVAEMRPNGAPTDTEARDFDIVKAREEICAVLAEHGWVGYGDDAHFKPKAAAPRVGLQYEVGTSHRQVSIIARRDGVLSDTLRIGTPHGLAAAITLIEEQMRMAKEGAPF